MTLSRIQILALILAVGLSIVGVWRYLDETDSSRDLPEALESFTLAARPQNDRFLFDYAGALRHYEEGAHRYLESISTRFHVEGLIVTLPTLPEGHSISTLAADLVNRWRIGAAHEGRGLLLLLIDDAKTVKLEVSYALEDVFTDSFTGFVEDMELGPYYRRGDVGTGLIAVMELLEQRAQIKHEGSYTPGQILRADTELLAGGAGAKRDLARFEQDKPVNIGSTGTGASSPEEAWKIMLTQWGGDGRDIDTDVYTAMTRRAMGDPNDPDPRTLNALEDWRSADYQVLRDGDHAVIWFGAVEGWNNAPFLFCNTGKGWKFDIVHQRRLVVMAEAPRWQITQGPYPYAMLMREAKQTTSKDLPLGADDLYRCTDDTAIAARMAALETLLAQNPDSIRPTMELLHLNVITGQRPNLVRPLIERAKRLSPEAPEPYRYAAIYNVNTFFQYETALTEIDDYLRLSSEKAFGYRMQGFLLYRLGRYADSIEALERAAALDPNDDYAYALMARDYALLARNANGLKKRRLRDEALAMTSKATSVSPEDSQRLRWLTIWLQARLG